MPTPKSCIAQAEEAERLAALVSYERDRARLAQTAVEWRARAAALQAAAADPEPPPPSPPTWLGRLLGARRPRGD